MKKCLLSIIVVTAFILFGCQAESETMVLLDEKIAVINVSKSNEFGGINENVMFSFTDRESIDVFERAITTAVKQTSRNDIGTPDYDVMVQYETMEEGELPTHGLQLWLGKENEKSKFMYLIDDAETVYVVSLDLSERLRTLMQ